MATIPHARVLRRQPVTVVAPRKKKPRVVAKPKPKPKPPTDPLAKLTQNQLVGRAGQLSDAALQPQLQDIARAGKQENANYAYRNQLLAQLASGRTNTMTDAIGRANTALNSMISSQASAGAQDRDAMAGLLRNFSAPAEQAAQSLGVQGPDPTQAGQLLTNEQGQQASLNAQTQQQGQAQLGAAAALASTPGQDLSQQMQLLGGEHAATARDLQNKAFEVNAQRPGLVRQNSQDLQQFELAKRQFGDQHANMLFQQFLAEKELNLNAKNQTFQQWLSRQQLGLSKRQLNLQAQNQKTQRQIAIGELTGSFRGKPTLGKQQLNLSKRQQRLAERQFLSDWRERIARRDIDWAQIGINKEQVDAQLAAAAQDVATAKTKKQQDRAKLRGDGMVRAMDAFSGFMAPKPNEQQQSNSTRFPFSRGTPAVADNPNTSRNEAAPAVRPYQRLFEDALRTMTAYTSTSDALRILAKSNYSDWRNEANRRLRRMKRRKAGGARGEVGVERMAPGANGQTRPT